jgi:hypothetical protein
VWIELLKFVSKVFLRTKNFKMKYFLIIISGILISSCAMIVNGNYTSTHIEVLPKNTKIIVDKKDTLCCGNAVIHRRRSSDDVQLDFISDSTRKTVFLESELSDAYVWGNFIIYYGYLIDLFSEKRYSYPDYVYFDLNDSIDEFNIWDQRRKDQFNIVFSIPYFNQFIVKEGKSQINDYGFGGTSVGVEIFLDSTDYISAQIGFASTSSWSYYDDDLSSYFSNIRYNWKNDDWHFGFGVSYHLLEHGQYIEQRSENQFIGYSSSYYDVKQKEGWGLALSTQYHLTKRFYMGLLYQSLFYNMDNAVIEDDHIISLEFIWKINLVEND